MQSRNYILSLYIIAALILVLEISSPFHSTKAQTSEFPALISFVEPTVPGVAVIIGASGKVNIEFVLNSKGEVESVKDIQGHPILCRATVKAVLQWKFAPPKEKTHKLQLEFDYSLPFYEGEGITNVIVSPYQLELKARLTQRPLPPETTNYIPADWQPEIDRCEVHGELFKKDKVAIIYGLTVFPKGYLEAKEKLFPHSNTEEYGGCVVEMDGSSGRQISPKYAEILYCQKCRIAETNWVRKNRNKSYN